MQVTIKIRNVGQAFGVRAMVISAGKTIHSTGTKPYGFNTSAYADAKNWADKRGYVVRS